MTHFPLLLDDYANRNTEFPFNMEIHRITGQIRSHRHNFLEFYYVMEGSGMETIDGRTHFIGPGAFRTILPYQVHEIGSAFGGELVLYNCSAGLETLFDGVPAGLGLNRLLLEEVQELSPLVTFEGAERRLVKDILDVMYREFHGNGIWRSMLFRAKLIELMVRFDRLRRQTAGPVEGGDRHEAKWRVIQYVYTNYHENLTLTSLSERFGLNETYISALFKPCLGQTFQQFLHQVRIQHASHLLLSTEMPVTAIGFETGFDSYETFWRVFKLLKGVGPSAYRKQYRKQPG